jgi:hypothetical protein
MSTSTSVQDSVKKVASSTNMWTIKFLSEILPINTGCITLRLRNSSAVGKAPNGLLFTPAANGIVLGVSRSDEGEVVSMSEIGPDTKFWRSVVDGQAEDLPDGVASIFSLYRTGQPTYPTEYRVWADQLKLLGFIKHLNLLSGVRQAMAGIANRATSIPIMVKSSSVVSKSRGVAGTRVSTMLNSVVGLIAQRLGYDLREKLEGQNPGIANEFDELPEAEACRKARIFMECILPWGHNDDPFQHVEVLIQAFLASETKSLFDFVVNMPHTGVPAFSGFLPIGAVETLFFVDEEDPKGNWFHFRDLENSVLGIDDMFLNISPIYGLLVPNMLTRLVTAHPNRAALFDDSKSGRPRLQALDGPLENLLQQEFTDPSPESVIALAEFVDRAFRANPAHEQCLVGALAEYLLSSGALAVDYTATRTLLQNFMVGNKFAKFPSPGIFFIRREGLSGAEIISTETWPQVIWSSFSY